MSWPSLPPQGTKPWYAPFSATWAAAKAYIDTSATSHNHFTADVRNYGAVFDGSSDDSAAFRSAMAAAKAAARPGAAGGNIDPLGTFVLELPAGTTRIEDIQALLGDEAMTSKASGLRIVGQGSGITTVTFAPATAGALMRNDYWLSIRIEGVRFHAETPGCTFMESYTTHSAQDYIFTDVVWDSWKYGFDLQGDDNNSEYRFVGCNSRRTEAAGAFLYIGTTGTSDQFLNYWFFGHKHWSTSAPLIDAAKGGSFHIYGLDVSDFAAGEAATYRPVFALRGTSHSEGVCSFTATGVRVEGKSNFSQLLYCEWPQGVVSFTGVDFTSQRLSYTYDRLVHVRYENASGAAMSFRNCALPGIVRVKFAVNDWSRAHRLVFDGCDFGPGVLSPSEAVVYDTTAASGNLTYPMVEFVGCRGGGSAPTITTGAAVWDATVGWNGECMTPMRKRSVSVRAVQGAPWAVGNVCTVHLPVGALITGLRVLLPAGALTATATGSTWTLATTDGTPVTICTVTEPGALNLGVNQLAEPAKPFLANTRARASVTVTPTVIDQNARNGVVLIEGYW